MQAPVSMLKVASSGKVATVVALLVGLYVMTTMKRNPAPESAPRP